MQLKAFFFGLPTVQGRGALGLLIARLGCGIGLMHHGWGKIQNPLHWMDGGPNPPAGILQLIAAVSEFFGGMGIAAGLLTPVAALGVIATLGYAISTHVAKGQPYFSMKGPSYELATLYLSIALMLALIGPGALSLDALVWRSKRRGS